MNTTTINLAIAIPTFNRVKQLTRAIASIERQIVEHGVVLHCVISNTASTDGTNDYLRSLTSTSIKLHVQSSYQSNTRINFYNLASSIPAEIDWVWLMGDDDLLNTDNAVQEVCKVIRQYDDPSLTLVHACQARRSRATGTHLQGTLLQLCNHLGYHEMLGWMSSLVVRRDRFVEGIKELHEQTLNFKDDDSLLSNKFSAYPHSAGLLRHCHADKAIFVDLPLVEPQDQAQTGESIDRWKIEHVGERYFFVIDDLLWLKKNNCLGSGVTREFFRYLNGHFWDRYMQSVVSDMVNGGTLTPTIAEKVQRMRSIGDLLGAQPDKKMWQQVVDGLEREMQVFSESLRNFNSLRSGLIKRFNEAAQPCYPFEVLIRD